MIEVGNWVETRENLSSASLQGGYAALAGGLGRLKSSGRWLARILVLLLTCSSKHVLTL